MAQHELLMAVAAPLIVLGRPLVPFLWALPAAWRRRAGAWAKRRAVRASWRALTAPLTATVIHGVTVWAWHAPRAYQATLTSELTHALQHVSFLATALLFWWALVRGPGARRRYGAAVLYLFVTAAHTGLLGALLAFSPTLWYPVYSLTTRAWGITPLEDQQLAGLVMWIPASMSYLVAALALFAACTALSMALLSSGFGRVLASARFRTAAADVSPALGVLSLGFGAWYALGALGLAPYFF
jgi:cytochrome c oxidase assembly factor CtaG